MITDPAIYFSLGNVYIVNSPYPLLMWPAQLIRIRCQCLLRFEIELHLFIFEHLPEHSPLRYQISQHKHAFLHFDQCPVYLYLLLNPAYELLIRVLAWLEPDLVGLILIILAYVDDFHFHGEFRLVVIHLVSHREHCQVVVSHCLVPTVDAHGVVFGLGGEDS